LFNPVRAFAMFVVRVIRRLQATQFLRIAASLSFTTLLGLVPLFTVAFAYVAPYSMFEHWRDALEPVLLKFLLPGSSGAARQYLAEFTAKTAELKGIGTALVVLTAVLLVAEVEREINAIWGVHEARSLPRRIIVYALGFVAVPALIGSAGYATSWLIDTSVAAVPLASAALPADSTTSSAGTNWLAEHLHSFELGDRVGASFGPHLARPDASPLTKRLREKWQTAALA